MKENVYRMKRKQQGSIEWRHFANAKQNHRVDINGNVRQWCFAVLRSSVSPDPREMKNIVSGAMRSGSIVLLCSGDISFPLQLFVYSFHCLSTTCSFRTRPFRLISNVRSNFFLLNSWMKSRSLTSHLARFVFILHYQRDVSHRIHHHHRLASLAIICSSSLEMRAKSRNTSTDLSCSRCRLHDWNLLGQRQTKLVEMAMLF